MKPVVAVVSVVVIGGSNWGSKASLLAQKQGSRTPSGREPVVVEFLPRRDARSARRRHEYSDMLHTGSARTQEMVIDGKAEFVDSRAGVAKQEIEKSATERKAKVEVSEVSPAPNKSVAFKVSAQKLLSITPKDRLEVILAITESALHSSVKARENAGHELQHSPVLLELKMIGVAGKNGQDTFTSEPSGKLDSKWNLEYPRAIVFAQEKKSRHILGAADIGLEH